MLIQTPAPSQYTRARALHCTALGTVPRSQLAPDRRYDVPVNTGTTTVYKRKRTIGMDQRTVHSTARTATDDNGVASSRLNTLHTNNV